MEQQDDRDFEGAQQPMGQQQQSGQQFAHPAETASAKTSGQPSHRNIGEPEKDDAAPAGDAPPSTSAQRSGGQEAGGAGSTDASFAGTSLGGQESSSFFNPEPDDDPDAQIDPTTGQQVEFAKDGQDTPDLVGNDSARPSDLDGE